MLRTVKLSSNVSQVQVSGSFPLDGENFSRMERGWVMTTTGIYSFTTRSMSLTWPMSGQLAWYVDFNSQLIRVVFGASESECGKLAFNAEQVYDKAKSKAKIA